MCPAKSEPVATAAAKRHPSGQNRRVSDRVNDRVNDSKDRSTGHEAAAADGELRQQTETEETRTVGGGWGRILAGMCVESTIRQLARSGAPADIDVWTLQQAATAVVRDQHRMQRSQPWIRRSVAGYVGVYWWRFLPPPGQWKLIEITSGDDTTAVGRNERRHTADLTWLSRDGRVLVDEVKLASGLAYMPETNKVRDQLERHLQLAGFEHATKFVGVRFLPLGLPRRAMLLTPDGTTRLADTPYCSEGRWR